MNGHQAGDADQDGDFDQLDLVQVQQAAKYLTGQPATWGEGDWDGAPGGTLGGPPSGNNRFDQLDIVAALRSGTYLTGPYAALQSGDLSVVGPLAGGGDLGSVDLVYVPEPSTIELFVFGLLVGLRRFRRTRV